MEQQTNPFSEGAMRLKPQRSLRTTRVESRAGEPETQEESLIGAGVLFDGENIQTPLTAALQTETIQTNSWEEKWAEAKEKDWEVDFGLVVISGKPGSGTSSAAKILDSLYKTDELYKAGDTIRQLAGAKDRTRYVIRDPEVDRIVDGMIRKMTVETRKGTPKIAEAQIGGITVLETVQGLEKEGRYPEAPIFRFLFWATKEERVRRLKTASDEEIDVKKNKFAEAVVSGTDEEIKSLLGDELEKKIGDLRHVKDEELRKSAEEILGEYAKIHIDGTDEERRELLEKLGNELRKKTLQQVWEETTVRERDDIDWWRMLYPDLIGEDNPLEKNAKDAKGNNIYSAPAFDNTEWGSPERSAYEVHRYLVENGFVRPKAKMWPDRPIFLGYKPEDNII